MAKISACWPAAALTLALVATAGQAWAWGSTGHRIIGVAAARAFPAELPAFLRAPGVAAELGELSREADRSRGSGKTHDAMRDPGHFLDIDDDGRILAGPRYDALPPTLQEYDTAMRAAGSDSSKAGYLPYSLIDGWQQLTKDFGLWRAADFGVRTEKNPARRAWLKADRASRERLIVRDLGYWSHFVGDVTYPLHVSSHYNGWGDGPNPKGFTRARIHGPLEGAFVNRYVRLAAVAGGMRPYQPCGCAVEARLTRYVGDSFAQLEPLYQLEKDGGFDNGDARGQAFMTAQLATAASAVRDLTLEAWRASATASVGYPVVPLSDVLSGKVSAYDALYASTD